jgi:hypothetical protein
MDQCIVHFEAVRRGGPPTEEHCHCTLDGEHDMVGAWAGEE